MKARLGKYLVVKLASAGQKQDFARRKESLQSLRKDIKLLEGLVIQLRSKGKLTSELAKNFELKIVTLRKTLQEKEKALIGHL